MIFFICKMNPNYLYSPVNYLDPKAALEFKTSLQLVCWKWYLFSLPPLSSSPVQGITDYFNFFSTEVKWMHTDKQLQ